MSHSHWIHLLCASWEMLPSVHRAVFRLRISAAYLNLQSKSYKRNQQSRKINKHKIENTSFLLHIVVRCDLETEHHQMRQMGLQKCRGEESHIAESLYGAQ